MLSNICVHQKVLRTDRNELETETKTQAETVECGDSWQCAHKSNVRRIMQTIFSVCAVGTRRKS